MKKFKLWTGGNPILNKAVLDKAVKLGYSDPDWSHSLEEIGGIGCTYAGSSISIMCGPSRKEGYFDDQPQQEYSLLEFFGLPNKRTIFNPFTGKKVEVSEESYQALKDSFND